MRVHSFVWGGLVICRGAVANDLDEIVLAAAEEGLDLKIFDRKLLQVIQLVYQRILRLIDAHGTNRSAELFTLEQAKFIVLLTSFLQLLNGHLGIVHDVLVYEVLHHLPTEHNDGKHAHQLRRQAPQALIPPEVILLLVRGAWFDTTDFVVVSGALTLQRLGLSRLPSQLL